LTVRPLPAYEKSVFINCPFDSAYRDLLLAIVFSVFAHGFVPRTARETEGEPEPRFSRILATIAASKYSIHDLSRFSGEGDANFARLNMPLELGMAAAFRFERENSDRPHRWLALGARRLRLSNFRVRSGWFRSREARRVCFLDNSRGFRVAQDAGRCPGPRSLSQEYTSELPVIPERTRELANRGA
jgi:hypothetical protein